MTSIRWVSVKLIVFTIVTIIVTGWLATIIANVQPFTSPYQVTAQFEDATGLLVGDVVKAAGVTVGRVDEVRVENGVARVAMSLQEGTQIPADVGAEIAFRNLVGQRMVVLTQGDDPTSELLAGGDEIPIDRTEGAFDLTVLFNGLRPLIRSTDPEDINIVSREVVAALKGRTDEVEGVLENVADISFTLAGKDRELTSLLDNVNVLTDDLSARDAQLRRTLGNIRTFLDDIAARKADLEQAIVALDDAAVRFGRIIERNDRNIVAEVEDLSTILDAVDDERAALRRALRSLPEMLIAVERATTYGQWTNIHLIHACKDDFGTCGRRGR